MKFKSANSEIRKSTIDSKLFSSSLHIKSTRKAYFSRIFCICNDWVKWYENQRRQLEKLRLCICETQLLPNDVARKSWRRSSHEWADFFREISWLPATNTYLYTYTYNMSMCHGHIENLCFRRTFIERFFIRKKDEWLKLRNEVNYL